MKVLKIALLFVIVSTTILSCKKRDDETPTPTPTPTTSSPKLIFKFHFDSTQVRLNNFGQIAAMAAGHAGQSPKFNTMSSHYVELAQDSLTPLGFGDVLYRAPETTLGGGNAIDFDSSIVVGEGQTFLSVPLSAVNAGTYRWLRVSLAYQNYDITYRFYYLSNPIDNPATIAAFIGFNTYIRSFYINDSSITVNANKLQGFWAFETSFMNVTNVSQGQALPGATTVPNPLAFTSPVPAGSCVVTGAFPSPLVITGNETHDIVVKVSISTNKSFEWIDPNANGIFEPLDGDTVVDMGVRGLIPIVQ
jgi:hypothetical protein